MKNFIEEFKVFAVKGNIIDLAVGVIIGTAFGKIVTSLVGDVVMPVIGIVAGKINFITLMIGPIAIGKFLQASIDFVIVALVIFVAIKTINKIKRPRDL